MYRDSVSRQSVGAINGHWGLEVIRHLASHLLTSPMKSVRHWLDIVAMCLNQVAKVPDQCRTRLVTCE